MTEMLADGTTLLFVSHSSHQVKQLCKNVLWLDKGVVKGCGKTEKVLPQYIESLKVR